MRLVLGEGEGDEEEVSKEEDRFLHAEHIALERKISQSRWCVKWYVLWRQNREELLGRQERRGVVGGGRLGMGDGAVWVVGQHGGRCGM